MAIKWRRTILHGVSLVVLIGTTVSKDTDSFFLLKILHHFFRNNNLDYLACYYWPPNDYYAGYSGILPLNPNSSNLYHRFHDNIIDVAMDGGKIVGNVSHIFAADTTSVEYKVMELQSKLTC
ncbi:hypothetical protein AHAS_Ahas17G0231400 [Arachis hypogaea]